MATSPDTVVDALRLLRDEGYDANVQLEQGRLVWSPDGPDCHVASAEVERVYRFEGQSDPGDEMIVFGLRHPETGQRGTLASAFGPDADPELLQHLIGLSDRHR